MTDNTLLYRQVHPSWVQQGRVTSQVFKPTPKDKKKLSAYDGDQISAAGAWEHFTTVLKFSSIGVLAVTKGECQSLGLATVPDPTPFPEHVVIDFANLSENDVKRKATLLRAFADARGWQFRAEGVAGS